MFTHQYSWRAGIGFGFFASFRVKVKNRQTAIEKQVPNMHRRLFFGISLAWDVFGAKVIREKFHEFKCHCCLGHFSSTKEVEWNKNDVDEKW